MKTRRSFVNRTDWEFRELTEFAKRLTTFAVITIVIVNDVWGQQPQRV